MRLSLIPLLALGILAQPAPAQTQTPDLKITTRFTQERQPPSTTTQYIKGPRSRIERDFAGHHRVTINQCDQHQVLQLDPEARQYTTYKLDDQGRAAGTRPPANARPLDPSGGTLAVNIETADTGERKTFFGYTARHIIEKETRTPGPGAVSQGGETIRDGWYINLDVNPGCGPKRDPRAFALLTLSSSRPGEMPKFDKIEVRRKGAPVTGLAVSLTTKQSVPRPNADPFVSESVLEVIELSNAPLAPALFEAPPGYKKVDRLPDYIAPGTTARSQPAASSWDALKRYWASLFR